METTESALQIRERRSPRSCVESRGGLSLQVLAERPRNHAVLLLL
ncbi:unnamed protein product [Linum tenue]|uniref:Uncharacterized protein n=1 Tax=Linum tenue TaxID=586396 RepID=A0AAV0R6X4_9ROSI|nr:unnamed protein product [Linum tenue]